MKVLALIGSPRRGGNTDLLVDQVLEGSRTKGHVARKLYLYDYTISVCSDCRGCKKGDYVCCVHDEMQQLYPLMADADVIVFGTPVYWYGPTAKMKMLLDRLRPFVENKKLVGKRAVVVLPSAEGSKACGPLIEMFRLSFEYLGMELVGKVLGKAYEKGEILENKKELDAAYKMGALL
ncbi:MAG: flavodoxin family protein [Candidatus Bathyarchaeota archaeon]|nr:flavodoxin family protein [Candidatus Bathyarchaeum sp.]